MRDLTEYSQREILKSRHETVRRTRFRWIIYKHASRTSQRTQSCLIKDHSVNVVGGGINRKLLLKKCDMHVHTVRKNIDLWTLQQGGTYSYHLLHTYRSSKWWEVKDWGESVSELMIKKNSYKKLYTELSYLGVFTFCTCCILICLLCFVASFKLCCVWLLLVLSCLVCIVASFKLSCV